MSDTPNGETQDNASSTNTKPEDAQTDTVAKADYDKLAQEAAALRKEKEQAEMERNLQRNKLAEEERKKAEDDKNYDKLFELMKADNAELKAKLDSTMTSTQADKARAEALDSLPEKLRTVAKELLDKATTPEQIQEKVVEMTTLAKSLGVDAPPKVDPLNPNPKDVKVPETKKTPQEVADDLHRRIMASR